MKSNDPLDELFAAVRAEAPNTEGAEFAFETRLLARIREERSSSWFSWAWRLSPYFAALALAVGAWGYANYELFPDGESVSATLQQGGLGVLEYYLGGDE